MTVSRARNLVLYLLVLSCGAIALATPPEPPRFAPAAEEAEALRLDGETWIGDGPGVRLWLRPVDAGERLNFIRRTTGLGTDPWAGRPDRPPQYLTFLLVIENLGTAPLDFNPQGAWLRTNRQQVHLPRGLADLSFNYRIVGKDLPPAYERVQDALFETAVTVPPGGRSSGLLVYDAIHSKTKRWELALRMTLPDGEPFAVLAPYRRVKPGREKE